MKKFFKNNQSFTCVHCGAQVPPHPSSSRDHCNVCLYGLHVDNNPGDTITYVLQSEIDGNLYIEWTDNIERRLKNHNKGKVKVLKIEFLLNGFIMKLV